MKQVFQDLNTGETRLADVPRLGAAPGQLLIRSQASLVSTGDHNWRQHVEPSGWVSIQFIK